MASFKSFVSMGAFLFASVVGYAQTEDALGWLQRAASAARNLNYSGVILYQYNNQTESARLLHLRDETGEYEKLISLDGPAREIIRNNDQVVSYFPDSRKIKIEQRSRRTTFPALFPEQLATLAQNYSFRETEVGRIAGLTAKSYLFEPKDNLRYGYKFWVDPTTGLLLKAKTLNEQKQAVEVLMFTDLQINPMLDKQEILTPSSYASGWNTQERSSTSNQTVIGWQIKKLPPGFRKIREDYRIFAGRQQPVAHFIFSDGLAAISVFVEPSTTNTPQLGMIKQGAINRYSVRQGEHIVTVLGEVPEATIIQIARAVAPIE